VAQTGEPYSQDLRAFPFVSTSSATACDRASACRDGPKIRAVGVDPIDQQVGARVRALRESRGVTLKELALSAGVAPAAVEACEAGSAPAAVSLIVKLARVLDGSAAELIGDDRGGGWRAALDELARDSADGSMELVFAFSSIPDKRVRRAILDLAWTLIDAQDQINLMR
jgi:transcriptional regulator with XRE-family HTH domain